MAMTGLSRFQAAMSLKCKCLVLSALAWSQRRDSNPRPADYESENGGMLALAIVCYALNMSMLRCFGFCRDLLLLAPFSSQGGQ